MRLMSSARLAEARMDEGRATITGADDDMAEANTAGGSTEAGREQAVWMAEQGPVWVLQRVRYAVWAVTQFE